MADEQHEQHAYNDSKRAADAPEVTTRLKELINDKATNPGLSAFRTCTCGAISGSCRCTPAA